MKFFQPAQIPAKPYGYAITPALRKLEHPGKTPVIMDIFWKIAMKTIG
jgi:hypothetical protein